MQYENYNVKDGVRTLKVEGVLLSESSSWSKGKSRWVEFKLYRTPSNVYVVSRVGMSLYYHNSECSTVARNRLSAIDEADLDPSAIPCDQCRPSLIDPEGVFPETPRNWAQVCQTPRGVVESLVKYDDNNTEYLTNVARRLLEIAADNDDDIRQEYLVEVIR